MAVEIWLALLTLLTITPALHSQQEPVYTVCARGFFLSEQHTCLPCNCKGHAPTCEDITGICIECQHHSTGDFCELCEDGYVLERSADGQHECQPCACPLALDSNNFAQYCDKRGAVLRCVCQDGYAGHYCERCAPGYYGEPLRLGSSCRKCECNDNSDPNLIFNECHNETGRCLHCWDNTAGEHCERCAPGYYGNAIPNRRCQECECNKCGTASCDDRTGVCHCKPGVTGRLCDQCEEGYFGFGSCAGCRRCECASAALRATCHPLTHTCQCQPGAGGRYCQRCLPGYWDYSPAGCKKCDCPEESCDTHTGECLPETSQISECSIDCDECIWHLIGDVRQSNKTVQHLRNSVLNISSGAAANDRIKYYNYTALRLQAQFVGWRNKSSVMREQTGHLEDVTDHMLTRMNLLTQQEMYVSSVGSQVHEETLHTATLAQELITNLTSLNTLLEEMLVEWELYGVQQQQLDPEVERVKLQEAERVMQHIRTLDLKPKLTPTSQEAALAHQLLPSVRQLEKRVLGTEGRVPVMKELLKRFSSKLADAQTQLNRAQDTLLQSHITHTSNTLNLQRRREQLQRLQESYDAVNNTILEANDLITQTDQSHTELDIMVTNVSGYHAEVDGARKQLQDKIDQLSQADQERVQEATDYADQLMRHAEELQHNLKGSDANGFVQKALEAGNVYNNIVHFIDDANITGLTTLNLSRRAQDAIDAIKSQLNFLKTQSLEMFKQSVVLHSEYQEVDSNVLDTTKYIEETKEMTEASHNKLDKIRADISIVQKDRTPARLQFTQEVAEGTLNRSVEVLGTVTPMRERVDEWSQNMKKNLYSTSAYEQAINSANNTVEDLSKIVPELLAKLRIVEEKRPVNNVSTNIMRIRELIAQARSIARKVQVSMKFNGQSAVEVHPHSNLEDMKAVTSISLYVRVDPDKDPIEDRFLLYLGDRNGRKDYMGLAIKNDNLVYVYNLGGEDVEIPLSSKPVSSWPAVFNLVRVERLGRHGKVFLTVPSQNTVAEQKFIQKGEAIGIDSLFDLNPKDTVFIIGGVPPDIKIPPALSLAPFVGCIELASLNNDVISLYNFKKLHMMNVVTSVPCPRYKLAFSQGRGISYLFDGMGYALIKDIERRGKISVVTRFDIEVRTVANNGILFLMVNQGNLFMLELRNGFLRLEYDFGFAGGPVIMESNMTKLQINDARYHEVSVIYHFSKKVILLVDRSFVKSLENEKKPLPFTDIYIGGAPSSLLQSRPELSSLVGLKGCVKGFQFQKKDFNLLEEPGTIGISSGCPEESFMSRQVYFTGQGYLSTTAKISPFSSFEAGLNFKTLQPFGLLFHYAEGPDELSLSLENGGVVLQCRGTRVKSHKGIYSNGRSHFLVASISKDKYQLVVDDQDKREKKSSDSSSSSADGTEKLFFYGGSPHSKISNFTGCISNAYISRQDRDVDAEDFLRYTQHDHVSLQDCPVERPPAAHLSADHNTHSSPHANTRSRKVSRDDPGLPLGMLGLQNDPPSPLEATPCYLSSRPRAAKHAHLYGGSAHSRQEYQGIAELIRERSHFSVWMRTNSSSGLLFYMSGGGDDGGNHMALFLSEGRLSFTLSIAQHFLQLRTTHSYSDGHWHHVSFIRDGVIARLIVDGVFVIEDKLVNSSSSLHLHDPLYVGGIPPGHTPKYIQQGSESGFSGCLRWVQLNGGWLGPVSSSVGVVSCYEGSSEPGTYFSHQGGYVQLGAPFRPRSRLQLQVEVRPRVAAGLLMHHATTTHQNLSLLLHHGQVVFQVTGGSESFSVEVSPKEGICDGNWHKITVSRDWNLVQLEVDLEVKRVARSDPQSAPDTEATNSPVYIGGAPDSLLPVSLGSRQNYVGCMRNLVVNDSPMSFNEAVLVSGAVIVGTCPAS